MAAFRLNGYRRVAVVFWILTVLAITIWSLVPKYVVGWDIRIYQQAIRSLQAHHDPYADGIAVQQAFHDSLASHLNEPPPYTYVYAPLTLPVLRLAGSLPTWLTGPAYWGLCFAGMALVIWAGTQAVEEDELPLFALLAPAAVFFPGLLQNDALFSGNIAYILYGLVFGAAALGWRGKGWGWFYAAVLMATCVKAPMLSLLVIPVLSEKRQWLWTAATGLAGTALFAMQPVIWPAAFARYMEAVELQFTFNRDFGSSPAGRVAAALFDVFPYRATTAWCYLIYAVPFFCVLLYLSRRYFEGRISQEQWMPVVLVGAILMNPRIMEYDVAPLTIPMALLAWRFFGRGSSLSARILKSCVFFAALNIVGQEPRWKLVESLALVGVFVAGVWSLFTLPDAGYSQAAGDEELLEEQPVGA